jgi:hypothetical protein
MWAKDILIIDGVCQPGELIRQYRCIMPSAPVLPASNAVLVQLLGKDRFGKLQAITLVRCFRANINGKHVELDIRTASNVLAGTEQNALRKVLQCQYPKAYANAETLAALALIRNP